MSSSSKSGLSVDTMRQVDFWAGVPLCALSSLILRLVGPFIRRRANPPRNVLLAELSEMGSAVLVDPVMRDLKARGAHLHFVIFAKNKASLDLLATVPEDNIFLIRADGLKSLIEDTVRFLVWCREKEIDTAIDLEMFSRYSALLCGWSGAGTVVGYHRFHNEGLYRGDMLTHRVMFNPHIHVTRNFYSLVHALYDSSGDHPPAKIPASSAPLTLARADIPETLVNAVSAKLTELAGWDGQRPLVLLNANASDLLPQRRWSQASFTELAKRILARRPDALVLLTGSPGEREGLSKISTAVADPRCVNFAGAVEFRELVGLYHLSRVMVTNDSGPAHFASVTRMPTIVLFGPETPTIYGSLGPSEAVFAGLNCSPCVSAWNHRRTDCTDNKCLQAISVDEVFGRVQRYLG